MALEALNTIKKAEREAAEKIESARKEAEQKISAAKRSVAEEEEKLKKKLLDEGRIAKSRAEQIAEQRAEITRKTAENEAAKIICLAEKNKGAARKAVIAELLR